MGVSNLTTNKKNRTGLQKKQASKSKALFKEAKGSAGSSVVKPAGTSHEGSAVLVSK
jgi:hypothetical protein